MKRHVWVVACVGMMVAGCAGHRMAGPMELEQARGMVKERAGWRELPAIDVPRNPAEKYLKGMTIVLDPGHGGLDGGAADTRPAYKAGSSGAKEAYMNWRVASLLREMLAEAGVNVLLTREGDESVSLRERAEVANNAPRPDGGKGADLFISIHHNAVSDPTVNYPSVWYHGQVDDAETALDAARYVALELGKGTRTDVGVTAPLFSDQLMYPGGFGVLRDARVPAFLCECSFFTNPEEEKRLLDAGYNLREAYAIYTGLCEWAYCGRPTQSVPEVKGEGGKLVITAKLEDGLPAWWGKERNRVVQSTIDVTVDEHRCQASYDWKTRALKAEVALAEVMGTGGSERHTIAIHHANMLKDHNYPQRYRVTLRPEGEGKVVAEGIEVLGPKRAEAATTQSRRRGG